MTYFTGEYNDYNAEQEAAEYWDYQREVWESDWDREYPDWREQVLDPEDRDRVPEHLVQTVSQQDRDDLQTVLDWEEFHI